MPELPEVETTCRGIAPALLGQNIKQLVIRDGRLRWPVPEDLPGKVAGRAILSISRRAKYILIELKAGHLIWHLGMSGSMQLVDADKPLAKHDHIDLVLENGTILRYNDPRRFGCLLWGGKAVLQHALLISLGPEPLAATFTAQTLYQKSRGRKAAVKNFIMDQKTVVGVGNIYASEALFLAGILPNVAAAKVSKKRYEKLFRHIQSVLGLAIEKGGTTLKDFKQSDGKPGYFEQQLLVYGRAGEACQQCGSEIQKQVIGQRASYFCANCQR